MSACIFFGSNVEFKSPQDYVRYSDLLLAIDWRHYSNKEKAAIFDVVNERRQKKEWRFFAVEHFVLRDNNYKEEFI